MAIHNPRVGYCQGMSYLAASLLLYLPPASSFAVLRYFLEEKGLDEYYHPSMSGLLADGKIFQRMVKIQLPQLASHLSNNGIDSLLYVTPWFLSFFTGLTRWSAALLFMDMFFAEGKPALFRFALCILIQMESRILSSNGIHIILPLLQRPPPEMLEPTTLKDIARSLRMEELFRQSMQEEWEDKENRRSEGSHKRAKHQNSNANSGDGGEEPFWMRVWNSVATPKRIRSDDRESDAHPSTRTRYPSTVQTNRTRPPQRRLVPVRTPAAAPAIQRPFASERQMSPQRQPSLRPSSPPPSLMGDIDTSSPHVSHVDAAPLLPTGNQSPSSFKALKDFATPRRFV
jgi:hypothetical protein